MSMRAYLLLFSLVLVSSALAQTTSPPIPSVPSSPALQEPPKPCVRGPSQVRLGGIDLDQIKCEMFTLQQTVAQQSVVIINLQSRLTLLQSDLDAATKPKEEPKPKDH